MSRNGSRASFGQLELADFEFELPARCIAQYPPAERDGGRMMVLDRSTGAIEHHHVRELPRLLRGGDLLVVNATRVVAARLRGHKASGGRAEALLLGEIVGEAEGEVMDEVLSEVLGERHSNVPRENLSIRYRALLRHSGRIRLGAKYRLGTPALDAELVEFTDDGIAVLAFEPGTDPYRSGETPLPPYIRRPAPDPEDQQRYQTTYARIPGSVAAPTAGLHLSQPLLDGLDTRGIERAEVVLHVGLGTFRPLTRENLETGRLHTESYELPESTADAIARTRARGGRVVAVGTTTARVLESCADSSGGVVAGCGKTDLLLAPGSRFQVVDALLTNFHLPGSSLILLVAAFAGREAVLAAYANAIQNDYRFYSYGDAMLIQPV
ncbi:MAG: tRNA preQ1(34) S-adenosylmethionine ribosyltransferase-isomerase QueA [Myxococcota bacterium]